MSKGDVRRLAREATETAINTLVEVCSAVIATETLNEQGLPVLVPMHPAAARVSAAMALLERGYGKPVQPVAVGGAGDFDELTDEELQAFILQESILIVRGHDEGSS